MSFTAKCSNCGATYDAEDDWLGMEAECPGCETTIVIAAAEPEKPKLAIRKPGSDGTPTEEKLRAQGQCPKCQQALPNSDAVICIECGYNLKTGQKMATGTAKKNLSADEQKLVERANHGARNLRILGVLVGLLTLLVFPLAIFASGVFFFTAIGVVLIAISYFLMANGAKKGDSIGLTVVVSVMGLMLGLNLILTLVSSKGKLVGLIIPCVVLAALIRNLITILQIKKRGLFVNAFGGNEAAGKTMGIIGSTMFLVGAITFWVSLLAYTPRAPQDAQNGIVDDNSLTANEVVSATASPSPSTATPPKKREKIVRGGGKQKEVYLDQIESMLVDADGKKVEHPRLADKDFLVIYFSAHWCGPCQAFTPQLVRYYNENSKKQNFEVIFVSSDRSQPDMQKYMREAKMPWPAIDFNKLAWSGLKDDFGNSTIPNLVKLDFKGKKVVPQSLGLHQNRLMVITYGPGMADKKPKEQDLDSLIKAVAYRIDNKVKPQKSKSQQIQELQDVIVEKLTATRLEHSQAIAEMDKHDVLDYKGMSNKSTVSRRLDIINKCIDKTQKLKKCFLNIGFLVDSECRKNKIANDIRDEAKRTILNKVKEIDIGKMCDLREEQLNLVRKFNIYMYKNRNSWEPREEGIYLKNEKVSKAFQKYAQAINAVNSKINAEVQKMIAVGRRKN